MKEKKSESQRPWWRIAGAVVAGRVKCLAQRKGPLRGNLNPAHLARHACTPVTLTLLKKKEKKPKHSPAPPVVPSWEHDDSIPVGEHRRATSQQRSRPSNHRLFWKNKIPQKGEWRGTKVRMPLQPDTERHRQRDREEKKRGEKEIEKKIKEDKKVETSVNSWRLIVFPVTGMKKASS